MKYTVKVTSLETGEICNFPDCSRIEAESIAEFAARNKKNQVFVTWLRPRDGQPGFLNSDGNHAITGNAW